MRNILGLLAILSFSLAACATNITLRVNRSSEARSHLENLKLLP